MSNTRLGRIVRKSDESRQTRFVQEMEARRREAKRKRGTDLVALAKAVEASCNDTKHADVLIQFRADDGLTYLAEGQLTAHTIARPSGELVSVRLGDLHIDAEDIISLEPKLTAEPIAAADPLTWLDAVRQSHRDGTPIHVEAEKDGQHVTIETRVNSLNSGRHGDELLWVNLGGFHIWGSDIRVLYPVVANRHPQTLLEQVTNNHRSWQGSRADA